MNTYLFLWNPNKWHWTNLEESIKLLATTGIVKEQWTCVSHRQIQPGDRAFLARVGLEPKGIFAAGFVSSKPFLAPHWNGIDGDTHSVMIDFDVLLNPDEEPILALETLNQGNLGTQNWTPQPSGISIKSELVDELEAVWFKFLTTQNIRSNPFKPFDVNDQTNLNEGTPNQVILTRYERNPYARKACIDHYGYTCVICGFNFERTYGEVGKDFIHVHHLTKIADVGKSYKIDPINDLRPVCPNCHAMIHRRKDAYGIDEVKEFVNSEFLQ